MVDITMKALLESGVHFGHRTHKWNPYMKPYIFTERNGIHIIDLQQTVTALKDSYALVQDLVAEGGVVLFVGTKRQAQETIQIDAERCGMPYVTVRWLGGMLTNWRTMRQRINELERLERMRDRGDFERLTKKEALGLTRQETGSDLAFSGISTDSRQVGPGELFVALCGDRFDGHDFVMDALAHWGVEAITTDRPDLMIEWRRTLATGRR